MAKKQTEAKSIVSKLIVDKAGLQEKIQERIQIGRDLLKINVTQTYSNNFSRSPRVNYNEQEQTKFFSAYKKWDNFNSDIFKHSFNNSDNEYKKEYEDSFSMSGMFGSDDIIADQKKTIQKKIDTLESFVERLEMIPTEMSDVQIPTTSTKMELTNKIFIVHGHGDLIKQTTARTLLQLGLEPIILHEQTDGGKTIIEKLEKNSSEVGFAIILLTADDEGKGKKETDYKTRARQNVVFEMGYFIGKLSRKKVFLLLEQGVEKPGDLDGIVYTSIDDNDGWKLKLVRELKAAGYAVSADQL